MTTLLGAVAGAIPPLASWPLGLLTALASRLKNPGCHAKGAGKSTIAERLARRGIASVDADGDPMLARSADSDGNVVEDPSVPDFAWLAQHSWEWDPGRLDVLIRAAAPATLYVCGGATNKLELADRFTQVFLPETDEPTMLARTCLLSCGHSRA